MTTGLPGREAFPLLRQTDVVYLDSAATSQKPDVVLDAMRDYYAAANANINRGAYRLCAESTRRYEAARERVARHLNASRSEEIVFVRGATEALNLIASGLAASLAPGDEIVLTEMEHHANIVPWQFAAERTGAIIRATPVRDDGTLDLDGFARQLGPRTRVVAFGHVSNALGTIHPVAQLVAQARAVGAITVVDGAQAVPHLPVDVQALGCDFYVFSGHKVYGPQGIGVLYGRWNRLCALPPYQGGGDMIGRVSFAGTTFREPPQRFEAGTPHVAGAVGLHAALDFVADIGVESLAAHETRLAELARERLATVPGVRFFGHAPDRAGIVTFNLTGVHPHDLATVLDSRGVAVRAGHHCCQPLWERFGVPATVRASFGVYNRSTDVDALVAGVQEAKELFG